MIRNRFKFIKPPLIRWHECYKAVAKILDTPATSYAAMTDKLFSIRQMDSSEMQDASRVSTVICILGLALAYYLASKLGLLFTIPSGYATAIWPPSGIAFAGMLILGYRVWPGVLLGAFLANFPETLDTSSADSTLLTFLLPLLIGAGATLQASVATFLVRRVGGFPNALASAHQVFTFLILGGLAASLLNASIGVSLLHFNGHLESSEFWINWVTWWAGDSMGVFIFTSLILVWFQHPRETWRERRLTLTIPVIATFVLAMLLVSFGTKWEQDRLDVLFNQYAASQKQSVQQSLNSLLGVMHSLQSFFVASEQVEREEFKSFAGMLLSANPFIKALSWNPLIADSERAEYEQQLQEQGFHNFQITELGASKQRLIAADRDEYIPIYYIEPLIENQLALGFDVYSDDTRKQAMELARDSGKAVSSGRIKLVQELEPSYGVLVNIPVYQNHVPVDTVEQRRLHLKGYLTGVIQLKDALTKILNYTEEEGIVHRLLDDSAPNESALLYQDNHYLDQGGLELHENRLIPGSIIYQSQIPLSFALRDWRLEILAGKTFIALHRSENTALILLVGLLITGMLGFFVLVVSGRDGKLRNQIYERNMALQESEENLKEAQRIAHVGSWYLDFLSEEVAYSEELFLMYGFDPTQPLPSLSEHEKQFSPESWQLLNTNLQRTRDSGKPYELELERVLADGSKGWMWVRGEAVRDETENIVGIRGVAQDISERKRIQTTLAESEAHYRKLFTESSIVMLLLDPVNGAIRDANDAAVMFYGYTHDQLRTMNISAINNLPSDEIQAVMIRARAKGQSYFEFRHRLANGEERFVQVSSGPIAVDGQVLLLSTILDVSERKKAEQALRDSENLMRDLFDKAPLAYQSLDMEGNILEVNELWLSQMGYQREEVIGRFIGEFISNDSIATLQREFPQFQDRGRVDGPIFQLVRKDGSLFLWEINGRIAQDAEGNSVRTHCMLTDVSEREAAQLAMIDSESRLRSYIDNAPIGVFVADKTGRYVNVNPTGCDMVGYDHDELCSGMTIKDLSGSDDIESSMSGFEELLQRGQGTFEIPLRRKDGSIITTSITANILPDGHVIGFATDISERKHSEASMREALVVFNASSQGIMTTDAEGNITAINPAFSTITGYTVEEVLGKKPSIMKSGRHDDSYYQSMWKAVNETGCWEGEIWNRRRDGQIYPQWQTITSVLDHQGNVVEFVALFSDITERKQQEEEIWHQANFDSLTGLANRNLLGDRLERALVQARRNENKTGLVYLDLDGFKWINDTLGHDVGDELLIEVASRIKSTLREQDTAARMGGDEFTVVIQDLKDMESIRAVGEKLVGLLQEPFSLQGSTHQISGSVGITVYPDDGEDVQTLLKNADIAMYKAKQGGKNRYQFYSRHMQIDTQARMQMESDLHRAIQNQEFILHYQPIVDGDSGELVGAEALIRWIHPEKGLISPLDFIPVAEDSGLIVPIGEWVLREAARQWSAWCSKGHYPLRISVNVSSPQFREDSLEQLVVDVLRENDVQPGFLVLEITESVLMDGSAEAEARMKGIKELGIKYALDDFGTGYSSLSYLKRFPVDIVKIDRSFINDCPDDHNDAHLVEAIVSMAHSLGLRVTAEGVETEAQYEFLRDLGCDYIQGYLVSRPLPADAFEILIERGLLLLPTDGASIEETRFLAALRQDLLDVDDWLERLLSEHFMYLDGYKSNLDWEMKGMNLRSAVTVHLDWRRRLDDFISQSSRDATFNVEYAGSSEECMLGQWMTSHCNHKSPAMLRLDKVHHAFHRLAGQIVDDHLNGFRTLARRALMGVAFREASRDVVTALIDCYLEELSQSGTDT